MAQMAQVGTERNTVDLSSASRQKSRNWCFTLNNYMEAEIKNICEGKYQYIFQEETGEEGTRICKVQLYFRNHRHFPI